MIVLFSPLAFIAHITAAGNHPAMAAWRVDHNDFVVDDRRPNLIDPKDPGGGACMKAWLPWRRPAARRPQGPPRHLDRSCY